MRKYNHRSMDLLRRIMPETAGMLTQALAAGASVLYKFYRIEKDTDLELLLTFSDFLEEFYTDRPENYLCYANVDEALTAYENAAVYLRERKVPERIRTFIILTELTIWYEFDEHILDYDQYNPKDFDAYKGFVDYLGTWIGLSDTEIHQLASGCFDKVKGWAVEEKAG